MNKLRDLFSKTLVVGVLVLFIGMGINPTIAIDNEKKSNISISSGNTLYVGGTGEGNYTRIQDAIDDASNGDTLYVYDDSSPYYENVFINKSMNLFGEDKDTTVIDGNKLGNVVKIFRDWVNVSGFTIQNSNEDWFPNFAGINIRANYTTISNNIIKNNSIGIAIWRNYDNPRFNHYLHNNQILDNKILSNNVIGIWFSHCNFSTIINNIVLNNSQCGIHTNFANYNIISGNHIENNKDGITIYQDSENNEIIRNNVTNSKHRGIFLIESTNNNISSNNFIKNKWGNAKFIYDIKKRGNKWNGNYWGDSKEQPHIIFGRLSLWSYSFGFGIIPWINIDLDPAQEPYYI